MREPDSNPVPCRKCRRLKLALVASAVLLTMAAVWNVTTWRNRPPAPDHPETIEVWVAAKDLPLGTVLTQGELTTFVVKKRVYKESLPTSFVADETQLYDKRLTRPVRVGETFDPSIVTKHTAIILPVGHDVFSLPFSVNDNLPADIGPATRLDILAVGSRKGKRVSYLLAEDMVVLGITNAGRSLATNGSTHIMLSFMVLPRQADLFHLAKTRGCRFEVKRRDAGKPLKIDRYHFQRTVKLLEDVESASAEELPIAPEPRLKRDQP